MLLIKISGFLNIKKRYPEVYKIIVDNLHTADYFQGDRMLAINDDLFERCIYLMTKNASKKYDTFTVQHEGVFIYVRKESFDLDALAYDRNMPISCYN